MFKLFPAIQDINRAIKIPEAGDIANDLAFFK